MMMHGGGKRKNRSVSNDFVLHHFFEREFKPHSLEQKFKTHIVFITIRETVHTKFTEKAETS